MDKILQEACNYTYRETGKVPIFAFYDGMTSSNALTTKNLKIYFVFENTNDFYYKDVVTFFDKNNLERRVTIKAISLDNFKENKKYLTSFIFAMVENNYGILKKELQTQMQEIISVVSLKDLIVNLKDKMYNNTLKLQKETDFTDYAKELSMVNIRINGIIISLLEQPEIDTALEKALEVLNQVDFNSVEKNIGNQEVKTIKDVIAYFMAIIQLVEIRLAECDEPERRDL